MTGPRLTAIYADTCQILHRVKTPTTSDRYSMMFVYSSTTPYYALLRVDAVPGRFPAWTVASPACFAGSGQPGDTALVGRRGARGN